MSESIPYECRHFNRCGGCSYLDIPYEEELRLKEARVRELLPECGGVFEGVLPAPVVSGYRNKMELAFGDEGRDGLLALGIRKKRSMYEVATPERCVLMPDVFRDVTLAVLDFFRTAGVAFYHRRKHTGCLRHLVLRRGAFTGELLVILSVTKAEGFDTDAFVETVRRAASGTVGVLLCENGGVADAVKPERTALLWGRDFYRETLCGLSFDIPAFSFFQTNPAGAEVLYRLTRECAGDAKLLYDLYCGTGAIAQVLAGQAQTVVGVEINADAVRTAALAARQNGIANCVFLAGDVTAAVCELGLRYPGPDVIVADPPRDGLHPKALPRIAAMGAERLVYVSCKPESLARDMQALRPLGYLPRRIRCVDMFPRTPNIETVCLFARKQ